MLAPRLSRRDCLFAAGAIACLRPVRMFAADSPAAALAPLLIDDQGRPITDAAAWAARRDQLRRRWIEFLKPLSVAPPPLNLRVVEEDRRDGVIRQLIEYDNAPGETLRAYLLEPLEMRAAMPGLVVLHSTSAETIRQGAGLGAQPEKAFGLMAARMGCVAICPMNFLWAGGPDAAGKYDLKARTQSILARYAPSTGMAKMLYDARRAVDLLRSLPAVDPARIAAIGHSLGAKESLYLAAFDDRVAGAVSSEGGIGLRLSNWNAPWYLGPAIDAPGFDLEHHQLLALIAPRPFLLLGGDSADGVNSQPFIDAAKPVYELHGKGDQLEFLNHHKGHAVPPEATDKIQAWLRRVMGDGSR